MTDERLRQIVMEHGIVYRGTDEPREDVIDALRQACAEERSAVKEECAKIADGWNGNGKFISKAIRSLEVKP